MFPFPHSGRLMLLSGMILTGWPAGHGAPAPVDPDCRRSPGTVSALREEFEEACAASDEKAALAVVEKGLPVRENDEDGNTPLSLAVRRPFPAVVKKLVAGGADVNARTKTGSSIVAEAVAGGDRATVEFLLKNGASPDLGDKWGTTPLILAAMRGRQDLVGLLIHAGASLRATRDDASDALFAAAKNGHAGLVRFLAGHGGRVNGRNADGLTPLLMAAMRGDPATTRALIAAGADTNLASGDRYKLSPLAMAAGRTSSEPGRNYQAVLELLVKAGARLDQADGTGKTPFEIAAAAGRADHLRNLLPPASSEGKPPEYITRAFVEALRRHRHDIVKKILELGFTPPREPVPELQDMSPLFFAIYGETDEKMTLLLLENGFDPNETRKFLRRHFGMIVGKAPEPKETEESALIAAVNANNPATVKALLRFGASKDWKDPEGKTAQDHAAMLGRKTLAGLLRP